MAQAQITGCARGRSEKRKGKLLPGGTLALAAFGLSGCVVLSKEVERPQVAARFASSQSAKTVAECVAKGLGREATRDGDYYTIVFVDDIRLRARWDFYPTLEGSQAELRAPADYDAGSDIVRGCAVP